MIMELCWNLVSLGKAVIIYVMVLCNLCLILRAHLCFMPYRQRKCDYEKLQMGQDKIELHPRNQRICYTRNQIHAAVSQGNSALSLRKLHPPPQILWTCDYSLPHSNKCLLSLNLSHTNPVHTIQHYLIRIHFNIILPAMPTSSQWFHFSFATKMFYSSLPCPTHVILLC
jgi:hypothetical protein